MGKNKMKVYIKEGIEEWYMVVTVGDKVDFTVRTFPKEKRIHCFVKLFPDSVEE